MGGCLNADKQRKPMIVWTDGLPASGVFSCYLRPPSSDWPANAVDILNGSYPKSDFPPGKANNINRVAEALTDLVFKCTARRTVRALAAQGNPVCSPKH